jgi:hypothetical protein
MTELFNFRKIYNVLGKIEKEKFKIGARMKDIRKINAFFMYAARSLENERERERNMKELKELKERYEFVDKLDKKFERIILELEEKMIFPVDISADLSIETSSLGLTTDDDDSVLTRDIRGRTGDNIIDIYSDQLERKRMREIYDANNALQQATK